MGRAVRHVVLVAVVAGCGRPITAGEARARLHPERSPPPPAPAAASPGELATAAASLPEPRRQIVEAALAHAGMPDGGLDCSALVQRVFATGGLSLPRTASQQLEAGAPVDAAALQPGDLVFFAFERPPADHVGIVAGSGAFVHVSTSQRRIVVERLGQGSFALAFVGARRYVQ